MMKKLYNFILHDFWTDPFYYIIHALSFILITAIIGGCLTSIIEYLIFCL